MKRLLPVAIYSLVLSVAASVSLHAQDLPPGQVDFGAFAPPDHGEVFVEVNIPGSLISIAASLVEKQEPDVAKLLGGLKGVHLDVVGLNEKNHAEIEQRAKSLRQGLSKKGWERIVTVLQKDQDIGVYLKLDSKSVIQGLTVVVLDGHKQAVFVNIVGNIKPEQIALLGERLNLDPLKEIGKEIRPFTGKPDGDRSGAPPKDTEAESEQ
jgi:Domain of unknown function (DUF4252)